MLTSSSEQNQHPYECIRTANKVCDTPQEFDCRSEFLIKRRLWCGRGSIYCCYGRLKFYYLTNLSLSNDIIPVSSAASNFGFIFDSDLSFSDQINSLSKSCHFHIRDIRRICHLLPLSAAKALANSLVSMQTCLYTAIHFTLASQQTNLNKLQRIQNPLACVITNTSKYQHITPTLKINTDFQSSKESSTNSVFSHLKHLQINNLHIFSIVFHFRHTLFLQDLLIHPFFPFHMSDHHLAEGRSLSLVHDFEIHYLLIPEIRILYQSSVPGSKHTSSKLHSLPRLFPIFLDCRSGFWFLLFSFYALSNITNNSWHKRHPDWIAPGDNSGNASLPIALKGDFHH